METELIMLGTGSAFPRHSYNSCFAIRTERLLWLTDGGGGNGIFDALENAGIKPEDINHLFITHAHTDHILGAVWILRRIVNLSIEGKSEGEVNVYGNSETLHALSEICRLTFLKSYYDRLESIMRRHTVNAGDRREIEDVEIEFFDVESENTSQTGFKMRLPSGKVFAALGDEALTEKNRSKVDGADYLLCGAFCSYEDREIFRPYEKHHYTVRDVAEVAGKANVKTLMIFHSEDVTDKKKERYVSEAKRFFGGNVEVPVDGERLRL